MGKHSEEEEEELVPPPAPLSSAVCCPRRLTMPPGKPRRRRRSEGRRRSASGTHNCRDAKSDSSDDDVNSVLYAPGSGEGSGKDLQYFLYFRMYRSFAVISFSNDHRAKRHSRRGRSPSLLKECSTSTYCF